LNQDETAMIKIVGKDALETWVDEVIARMRTYGVQAKGDHFSFEPLRRAADLRLDYDVTILPPKKYLQPPRETLLRFSGAVEYESVFDEDPFVIFGIHPYDLEAILQMDAIFEKDQRDEHYLRRRSKAVLVACDVETVSENVFAGCMGTAYLESGFDILITKIDGGDYVVDIQTDAGRSIADSLKSAKDADKKALAARREVWNKNKARLRRHKLEVPLEELPALLEAGYEHPIWEERAQRCYSCGSCNLVCPTCYCFDVRDDVGWDLKHGVRARVWDGCLLAGFAEVAGGHNFRRNRADRYRHRYYRKGKYLPEMIGKTACVGCGRCITACTAKIANPVEVYNALLEEKDDH